MLADHLPACYWPIPKEAKGNPEPARARGRQAVLECRRGQDPGSAPDMQIRQLLKFHSQLTKL